jgi:hypothetical protein
MLAQPNDHPDAIKAMDREIEGGKCEFDATLNDASQRLQPISFISKRVTTESVKALHSFIGEAGTGVWAMEKYKFYLFGKEFTWICDCSGLIRFFEHTELPTHQAHRWKLYMLRFDFTIVHRPDRMMRDVDMLSRYNNWFRGWRPKPDQQNQTGPSNETKTEEQQQEPKSGTRLTLMMITAAQVRPSIQYVSPTLAGPRGAPKSQLANAISTERNLWTINLSPTTESTITDTGIQGQVLSRMSTQRLLPGESTPTERAARSRRAERHDEIHWILAEFPLDETTENITNVLEMIAVAIRLHSLQGIVIFINATNSNKIHPIEHRIRHLEDIEEWYSGSTNIQSMRHAGGSIEKVARVIAIHNKLDPISAMTANLIDHPSPTGITEGLDMKPDIVDDYDWPKATAKIQQEASP